MCKASKVVEKEPFESVLGRCEGVFLTTCFVYLVLITCLFVTVMCACGYCGFMLMLIRFVVGKIVFCECSNHMCAEMPMTVDSCVTLIVPENYEVLEESLSLV